MIVQGSGQEGRRTDRKCKRLEENITDIRVKPLVRLKTQRNGAQCLPYPPRT